MSLVSFYIPQKTWENLWLSFFRWYRKSSDMKWSNLCQPHKMVKHIQNGQKHIGISRQIVWVCLTLLWGWQLKGQKQSSPNFVFWKRLFLSINLSKLQQKLKLPCDAIFASFFMCICSRHFPIVWKACFRNGSCQVIYNVKKTFFFTF